MLYTYLVWFPLFSIISIWFSLMIFLNFLVCVAAPKCLGVTDFGPFQSLKQYFEAEIKDFEKTQNFASDYPGIILPGFLYDQGCSYLGYKLWL